ncbi:acetyltransferase [Pseudomonas resinovorans]|uniref:acetyltransferase n=1 Tax=Metapseudomonas resinovorans TaxID=53412 RepID=UPI00237F2686|nr:acetyltransferase [Pseudomonas resinovorans]MDE3740188.1 acetyltransferase [Pseudomonas resinovorans]
MSIASADDLSLVILGAGGHAKVLLSLVQATGLNVCGVCDPELAQQGVSQWRGIKVLGGDEVLETIDPATTELINGIGQLVGSTGRRRVFERLIAKGFRFPVLVHPAAWVDATAVLHEGVQVMAGAVIQSDTVIGPNSIINTGASLDHDCCLGAHVHVAPGATLCGSVRVYDRAFIAAGATVIQGLTVGEEAVVGAGAVVVRDLAARLVLLGPAARHKAVPGE